MPDLTLMGINPNINIKHVNAYWLMPNGMHIPVKILGIRHDTRGDKRYIVRALTNYSYGYIKYKEGMYIHAKRNELFYKTRWGKLRAIR